MKTTSISKSLGVEISPRGRARDTLRAIERATGIRREHVATVDPARQTATTVTATAPIVADAATVTAAASVVATVATVTAGEDARDGAVTVAQRGIRP